MTEWRSVALAPATGRTLSGYAVKWRDTAAVLEGGERFDEQVQRGAFAASLRAGPPVILFAHGRSALGQLPVGRLVRIEEDVVGLAIEVEMYDDPVFAPVLDAVQSRGLRSLSIGFAVDSETWDRSRRPPLRIVRAADLIEISVVPRGAYPKAKVSGVRHAELTAERAQILDAIERLEVAQEIRADRAVRRRRFGVEIRAEMVERARQERMRVARKITIDRHRREQ